MYDVICRLENETEQKTEDLDDLIFQFEQPKFHSER